MVIDFYAFSVKQILMTFVSCKYIPKVVCFLNLQGCSE